MISATIAAHVKGSRIPAANAKRMARRLKTLCDRDDEDYWRLGRRAPNMGLPLLVVVHPGDMTEVNAIREVEEYSESAQDALAGVISAWQGDIAILHRFSSLEFVEQSSRATAALTGELEDALSKAVLVCYGDELETFARDLAPFAVGRPQIVVTGAYKDEEHGCVDHVARCLSASTENVSIHWSAYVEPDEDELLAEADDGNE